MYKYLFGPVPSRRLGMSLGVDLVPHKVCSLNCIYCECGATTNLTLERKEYVPFKGVIDELRDYMENHPYPDYITFSGAGEPTLNCFIGDILQFIKKEYPNVPVALLTNGTLFSDPKVRQELMDADLVLPSLDAVTDSSFQGINRPCSALDVLSHIDGLEAFAREFTGEIWLEVLILPGYNDDEASLEQMKKAFQRIRPHRIQINTLDRPGVIGGIRAANRSEMESIVEVWGLPNVEIIAKAADRNQNKAYREDVETAIMETISRRPCTLDDMVSILGIHANEVNKYLRVLDQEGKIETVRQERGVFYALKR